MCFRKTYVIAVNRIHEALKLVYIGACISMLPTERAECVITLLLSVFHSSPVTKGTRKTENKEIGPRVLYVNRADRNERKDRQADD